MDRLRQKDMDNLAPGGKVKDFVVGAAFGPGITIEMCLLKRNLNHVRRTLVGAGGEVTPPLSDAEQSEGNRSDGEEAELETEIENVKQQTEELVAKLATVAPLVPEQNAELPKPMVFEEGSVAEALNGVDLD